MKRDFPTFFGFFARKRAARGRRRAENPVLSPGRPRPCLRAAPRRKIMPPLPAARAPCSRAIFAARKIMPLSRPPAPLVCERRTGAPGNPAPSPGPARAPSLRAAHRRGLLAVSPPRNGQENISSPAARALVCGRRRAKNHAPSPGRPRPSLRAAHRRGRFAVSPPQNGMKIPP